jgi:hypothetical protein
MIAEKIFLTRLRKTLATTLTKCNNKVYVDYI